MARATTLLWLGTDHGNPREGRVAAFGPGVVTATAAGDAHARAKKSPNEDSLAVVRAPDGAVFALVADAHFGPSSGELAAGAFASQCARGVAPTPEALAGVLRRCDEAVRRGRSPGDGSETTAVAVALAGARLVWASVGDSLLYVLRAGGGIQPALAGTGVFLGASHAAAVHAGKTPHDFEAWVETGALDLAPGDLVVLASDGIEPEMSGLDAADFAAALRTPGRALLDCVAAVVERCSQRARGGGGDNVSLVALEVVA